MMGVADSSRSVRVSQVLSSSTPACRNEDVSASEEELASEDDDDKLERSVKAAVVLISEQVDDTLELMLEPGTSFSCEEATSIASVCSEAADDAACPSTHSFCKCTHRYIVFYIYQISS